MKTTQRGFLAFLLVASLLLSGNLFAYAAQSAEDNLESPDAFNYATSFLTSYYFDIDTGTGNFSAQEYAYSGELKSYLENKVQLKRDIVDSVEALKENYALSFTLLSHEEASEYQRLTIRTSATFNYLDLKDIQSSFSETSEVILISTEQGYKIYDWYTYDDQFDTTVRGEVIFNPSARVVAVDSVMGILSLSDKDLENKQEEFCSSIRSFLSEEEPVYVSAPAQITPRATLYSLDRAAMVTWAKNNYSQSKPSSGGSNVTYFDFSTYSGNFDCTNFVSHALLAGGAVPYNTGNTNVIDSKGWYYVSDNTRSDSWARVTALHDFIIANTTKGPAGSSMAYAAFDPRNGNAYSKGDIVQFWNKTYGNWRHSTLVTDYYSISGSSYAVGALVAGRTNGTTNYFGKKAAEISVGEDRRVIVLSGYYK